MPKRRNVVDPLDSDDDSPEEVTLATGKAKAAEQRVAEKQQQQANKARRKTRNSSNSSAQDVSAPGEEQHAPAAPEQGETNATSAAAADPHKKRRARGRGRRGAQDVEVNHPAGVDAAEAENDAEAGGDFLPPEVLAALANRKQQPQQGALPQASKEKQEQKTAREKQQTQRKKVAQLKQGPVIIKVLDEQQAFSNSGAAAAFVKSKLLDCRKRSHDMIQQRKGLFGPASKFV